MWLMFGIGFILACIILYVPGFFFFNTLKTPPVFSFICAPVFSIVTYELLAALFSLISIKASFYSLFIPLFLTTALVWYRSRLKTNKPHPENSHKEIGAYKDIAYLGLYLSIGIVSTIYLVDSPRSFVPTYDNLYQYALARSYLNSGIWSPIYTDCYLEGTAPIFNPLPDDSYYPTAWHVLVAFVASALTCPLPVAANVISALFCSVIFPGTIFLLMKCIFEKNDKIVGFGAFIVMAFSAYPWVILVVFPLLPNFCSLALVPILIVSLMRLMSLDSTKRERLVLCLTFLLSVIALYFVHPNSIFTAMVFLTPFVMFQIGEIISHKVHTQGSSIKYRIIPAISIGLLAIAFWSVLYKLPFLQNVVLYSLSPITSSRDTLVDIATMSFTSEAFHIVLSGIVLIGFVAILRKPKYIWLDGTFILSMLLYYCAASLDKSSFLKSLLVGFWYSSPHRVAAIVVLSAIPIASVGLETLHSTFQKIAKRFRFSDNVSSVFASVLLMICILICYIPSISCNGNILYQTPFEEIYQTGKYYRDINRSWLYTDEEFAFVEDVKKHMDPDDVVLNIPSDGSLLAYSINNLSVVNRYMDGYGTVRETTTCAIIRKNLNEVSFNPAVRQAVDAVGASYVLFLEQDSDDIDSLWPGYRSINDTTPGFELVLSKGDMRLYKIT